MSSNVDDNFVADDTSDVPACAGATQPNPRRSFPVAALFLSLLCHAAAGAALTTWAWRHITPTLRVAGGAGEGTASAVIEDAIVAPDKPDLGDGATEPVSVGEYQPTALTDVPDEAGLAATGFSDALASSIATAEAQHIGMNPAPISLPRPRAAPHEFQAISGDGIAAGGTPIPASTNRPPRYPREALQRQWQGRVIVEVDVTEGGDVHDARVASSSGHHVLDAAALDAVRQWRFIATDGSRLAFQWTGTVPVEFVLKKGI